MSALLESTISDIKEDIRAMDAKVTALIPLNQTVPLLAGSINKLAVEVGHLTEWKASQAAKKTDDEPSLKSLAAIALKRWQFYALCGFIAFMLKGDGLLKLVGLMK